MWPSSELVTMCYDVQGLRDVAFLTSDTIWGMETLPQGMLILGGGPIGVELAQAVAYILRGHLCLRRWLGRARDERCSHFICVASEGFVEAERSNFSKRSCARRASINETD